MLQWRQEGGAETEGFLAHPSPLTERMAALGATLGFERNREIFGEGEPAEHYYHVVTGAVRLTKILSDGRRQIGAFYLPGDIFGFEAKGRHAFSAEAVVASRILIAGRGAIVARAARDPDFFLELWNQLADHLQRTQAQTLILARMSAMERIAAFLLQTATQQGSSSEVNLPMSRQDIADYVGLTIETVSRMLKLLESRRVIAMPASRRILLRGLAALREMADTPVEDHSLEAVRMRRQ